MAWADLSLLFFFFFMIEKSRFVLEYIYACLILFWMIKVKREKNEKWKKNKLKNRERRKKSGEKKNLTKWQKWGPQIVWKILSDGKWVMVPNRCEKLSNEWWMMSYEWWVMSDGNWVMKFLNPNNALLFTNFSANKQINHKGLKMFSY